MLFTMVIDVLNSLMLHAMAAGILRRLTPRHIAPSVSLYTDDVAIFCHPSASELSAVHSVLHVFGHASGLHTNFDKCSATPIHCSDDEVSTISAVLACPILHFPIPYLGLPLSVRKVPTLALQPLIDRMVKKLSTWRASILSHGERLALVRHVLSAMPIHLLMAMVICQPVLKRINRIIREFLWHGRRDANGGHCLVNWQRVCRPLEYGAPRDHGLALVRAGATQAVAVAAAHRPHTPLDASLAAGRHGSPYDFSAFHLLVHWRWEILPLLD